MDLKFPMKRVVSVLTFAALGSMAGSAFSQSAEYRRGYDQGYRDGVEAASAQTQAQPPVMAGRIEILEARYGLRGASCDPSESLRQIAARRRHVDVKVDNALCGDPAPRQTKRLSVTYRCGDGPEQRVAGPEGSVVALSCR